MNVILLFNALLLLCILGMLFIIDEQIKKIVGNRNKFNNIEYRGGNIYPKGIIPLTADEYFNLCEKFKQEREQNNNDNNNIINCGNYD